jgi:hypothetical protein
MFIHRISEDRLTDALSERLRALPAHAPPAGGWNRLNQRLQARRRRFVAAGGGLALAASVLVAIGLTRLRPDVNPAAAGYGATATRSPEVAQLISRSQNLERELSSARPQVAVWNSGREAGATLLEQQLRRVDAQLNFADDRRTAERLWRERVRLMNALVDLHRSEEAPALQYASYQY